MPILLFGGNALAGCAPAAPFTVTVPAISYTGSADSVRRGDPIDSGWSPAVDTSMLFDLASCAEGATRGVVSPAVEPHPTITYSEGRDTAPIYPTGIEGIGYVLQMRVPGTGLAWSYIGRLGAAIFNSVNESKGFGASVRLRFVATYQLQPGKHVIPAQTLATAHAYNSYNGPSSTPLTAPATIQLAGSTTITVNAASCRMTTPANQSVTLPTVGQAAFAAEGSSAGRGVAFHIGMNCDANVALHLTMTDAWAPSNYTNTLSLARGSPFPSGDATARGVSVQVFYNGSSTPVSYGPDSSEKGNTNQWKIGQSTTATSYDIPFTASYVRTGVVTPGTVKAHATFTFSYQ